MNPLEDVLERLLHHPPTRLAFHRGELEELDPTVLDPDEVERAARRVRRQVLTRRYRGSGGLRDRFPRTIAAWRAAHPDDRNLDDLIQTFQCTAPYRAWRELGGPGLCLEEAFFRFAERIDLGDAAVRRSEYLWAAARALVVNDTPTFQIPAGFVADREGWVARLPTGALLRIAEGHITMEDPCHHTS